MCPNQPEAPQEESSPSILEVNEYVSNILDLRYDLDSRTIYVMEPICSELAERFIITLNFLDMIGEDPIRLVLSSPGGEETAGYAMFDAIRLAKCQVNIEGIGEVSSIAAVVIQAGDVRSMSENAVFMIHNGSIALGHMEQDKVQSVSRQIERGNAKYHKLLASRSALFIEEIRKMSEAETFLTAEEALEAGFIDEILIPTKKLSSGK